MSARDHVNAVPALIWERCPNARSVRVLEHLVGAARGYAEVRGRRHLDIAADLSVSISTVRRALEDLNDAGLIRSRWHPTADAHTLLWVNTEFTAAHGQVDIMDGGARGSRTSCDEQSDPCDAPGKYLNEAPEAQLPEHDRHEPRAERRDSPDVVQQPREDKPKMKDSPSALARYFETCMRKNHPDVEWQANPLGLAHQLKLRMAHGSTPEQLRAAIDYWTGSQVDALTLFDVMHAGETSVSLRYAKLNARWGQGNLAGAGYDARSNDPQWPWKFFAAQLDRQLDRLVAADLQRQKWATPPRDPYADIDQKVNRDPRYAVDPYEGLT